ncbi:hypothetical protein AgCh_027997 [Apium graveolens]
MEGTPDAPRCGFGSKVVNAPKEEGVEFESFDELSDEELRGILALNGSSISKDHTMVPNGSILQAQLYNVHEDLKKQMRSWLRLRKRNRKL